MIRNISFAIAGIGIVSALAIWDNFNTSSPDPVASIDPARLVPNWDAISSWPSGAQDEGAAQAKPDPKLVTTVIILDDSGSMGGQMGAAKDAVVEAVGQMTPESRVGVIALNAGMVTPVSAASDAAVSLPARLDPIIAEGGTPLGARLGDALAILGAEARQSRGFGIFRILVTTDGAATDEFMLQDRVAEIVSTTPIELATIGLGIGEGHALNVPGYTSYVSIDSVDQLASALREAAAEQTVFQPITKFED